MTILGIMSGVVHAVFRSRSRLTLENLALRQQIAILRRRVKRPKLHPLDRVFWVILSRFWADWRSSLAIVKPETVIRWHRKGFRLFWRWKSWTDERDRPRISPEVISLIRRMSQATST